MANPEEQLEDSKINILVAEDDVAIALAIKTILKNNFNCDITVVNNGEEAWNKIKACQFDLILSDWNMPLKTGCELLEDIRKNEGTRSIPFIMLTARADKNSVIDAVKSGVTDYIHKPFDRLALIDKVKKVLNQHNAAEAKTKPGESRKRQIVEEIATKLKNNKFNLPALSDMAEKLTVMAENNTASAAKVAELFKNDPIIAARLVALSNSAGYCGVKNCSNLEDAVTRIGIKDTINYIWLFCNNGLFESRNKQFSSILLHLRDHSLATAECARLIAKHLKQKNTNDYFYMGLMHDIGAVLVLEIVKELAETTPIDDLKIIHQALQSLHNQFGKVLLKRWNMPPELQSIAQYHDDLSAAPSHSTELLVIHFSNLYTQQIGYANEYHKTESTNISEIESAKQLQLSDDFIATLETQIKDYMREIHKMM